MIISLKGKNDCCFYTRLLECSEDILLYTKIVIAFDCFLGSKKNGCYLVLKVS